MSSHPGSAVTEWSALSPGPVTRILRAYLEQHRPYTEPNDPAILNLVCKAWHEALPDAFTLDPATDDDDDDATIGKQSTLCLTLDLDSVGSHLLRSVDTPAQLEALARRFCKVPHLRLKTEDVTGVVGLKLFGEVAMRHFSGVRRLAIVGPDQSPMPPLWDLPDLETFAAPVRGLDLRGLFSGLRGPLESGAISDAFPNVTAVFLKLFTDPPPAEDEPRTLTFRATDKLHTLRLKLTHDIQNRHYEDPFEFTVTAPGGPSNVSVIEFESWYRQDGHCEDDLFEDPQVVCFCGPLPGLRRLAFTLADAHQLMDLPEACPQLEELHVLAKWDCTFTWTCDEGFLPILRSLQPIAATLRHLRLRYQNSGPDEEDVDDEAGQRLKVMRKWLQGPECRACLPSVQISLESDAWIL